MIENITSVLMFLSSFLFFWLSAKYLYLLYTHSKKIDTIFDISKNELLSKKKSKTKEEFELKLLQSGIPKEEFYQIVIASVFTGAVIISLLFMMDFSLLTQLFIILVGVNVAAFTPFVYLEEQVKARIKRIEGDLAIFIDLLIIILEGGGGLNNAIDKVTTEATRVLGKDLLQESKIFKYEFVTYGSEVAYTNLTNRTGSEAIGTIVGFMRLSEETGIGVKSIFENQAQEIKSSELLTVEKKAATMNISITLVMFLFIIPAVIAMIAFPMSADALMPVIK